MDKELEEAMEGGCDGGRDCLGEECVCGEKHRQKLAAEVTRLRAEVERMRGLEKAVREYRREADLPLTHKDLALCALRRKQMFAALTPSPENPPAKEAM